MLTSFLIFFPLLASLLLFTFRPKSAKSMALIIALIEFIVSLFVAFSFDKNGGTQFTVNIPWVSSLGINFAVGIDGISLLLVLKKEMLHLHILVLIIPSLQVFLYKSFS